jgi:hypothetical protein
MKGDRFWRISSTFAITLLGTLTFIPKSLGTIPLQDGLYWGGGSRYIQITVRGDRACYMGSSSNGSAVASLEPDSTREGFYRVNGFQGIVVSQPDSETLLFGMPDDLISYKADYEISESEPEILRNCLESDEPFYEVDYGVTGD